MTTFHRMDRTIAAILIASGMAAFVPAQTPAPANGPAQPTKDAAVPASPATASHPAAPSDEDAKKLEAAAKVGPNHRALDHMAGDWTLEMMDLTPNAETTDAGTMTGRMVLGGRFLSMDVEGHANKKPFHGMGLWGYSNVDKRFESTWSDSLGTGITFMIGSLSGDGKTLTMTGEYTDPITAKKTKAREVTIFQSRDAFHSDFFVETDGKEVKVMQIEYKRVPPPAKPAEPKAAEPKKEDPKKDEKPQAK